MSDDRANPSAWGLAMQAAVLFAVDPTRVGGVAIRARPGPVRDRWMSFFSSLLDEAMPVRRVPLHVTDERLLGGLDLAATLKAGKPIAERGLLAEAHGGVMILAGAERLEPGTIARITSAVDQGHVALARDSSGAGVPTTFGIIALDEGIADDERVSAPLLDRLAFLLDLDVVTHREAIILEHVADDIRQARAHVQNVDVPDEIIVALCQTALAMGIESLRAPLLAVRVARAAAAFDGRTVVNDDDATAAAQLVLAPRATRIPADAPPEQETPDQPEPPSPDRDADQPSDEEKQNDDPILADMILEAAKAAIPAGLLAALKMGQERRARQRSSGRAGVKQKSLRKGRPAGTRRGDLKSGARLNVVETLRAAAAWQPLRRKESEQRAAANPDITMSTKPRRVEVRKDDFRIARFKQNSETTTIFVVDASGSAALNRLAEAKGAVELLLADCYVRRDSVALISFRGKIAELLLPPTRSLARAKRSLAGLPGGGGTPLALGIDAAAMLADAVRRKGQTPSVIVLTDGRANISRDGKPGRPQAEADGLHAARALALAGVRSLVIDTSPQPAQQSERLAKEMDAVYLPLPYANAATLSNAVKASTRARTP